MHIAPGNNSTRRLLQILVFVCLCSCAAPAQPPMAEKYSVASPRLPDCQNIDPNAHSDTFITDFYLTTWTSAFQEGALAGLHDGLGSTPKGVGAIAMAALEDSVILNGNELILQPTSPVPFCMVLQSSGSSVSIALERVYIELEGLGYRVIPSEEILGVFQTDFKYNEHQSAKWYDRFISTVSNIGDTRSAIYVLREVFISRSQSKFIQAYSVGANEEWIMTRTKQLIEPSKF